MGALPLADRRAGRCVLSVPPSGRRNRMEPPKSRGRLWRRLVHIAAATAPGAAGLAVAQAPANAAVSCSASYAKAWDNGGGGFGGLITITNSGDPITAWTLTFTFPGNQRIQNGWDGNYTQA